VLSNWAHCSLIVQDKHGIKLAEVAQRWLQHHSALGPNDGVLLGFSNIGQVDANIKYSYVLESLQCVIRRLTVHVARVGHFQTMLSSCWMMVGPKP